MSEIMNKFSKLDLCLLPTPIVPLSRLSKYLGGPQIYMKRDDLTGIAFGGNKNRKLEYLLADAIDQSSDTIITEGAVNSNHCLQTAACALKLGLSCELVLSGREPTEITGNYLLFKILGITIHHVNDEKERKESMKKVEMDLKSHGKNPYIIPTGGSNAIGALGYINCISEIKSQAKQMKIEFNHFVHAAGSSGTQAGMLIGKQLFYPKLNIISISSGIPEDLLQRETLRIIKEFKLKYGIEFDHNKIKTAVISGYSGPGYGLPSKEMIETVKLVSQLEGVFLDPVYNGKAMVGLVDMVKSGKISKDDNVLFLHSGGGPSIFNYRQDFY